MKIVVSFRKLSFEKKYFIGSIFEFRIDECIYFYDTNSIGNEEFLVVSK